MTSLIPIRTNSIFSSHSVYEEILASPELYVFDHETFPDFIANSHLLPLRTLSLFAVIVFVFDKTDVIPADFFQTVTDKTGLLTSHTSKLAESFFRTDVVSHIASKYVDALDTYFSFLQSHFHPHFFSNIWVIPEVVSIFALSKEMPIKLQLHQSILKFLSFTHPSLFSEPSPEPSSNDYVFRYTDHLFSFFTMEDTPKELLSHYLLLIKKLPEPYQAHLFTILSNRFPLLGGKPHFSQFHDKEYLLLEQLPKIFTSDYLCALSVKENHQFFLTFCDIELAMKRSPQLFV